MKTRLSIDSILLLWQAFCCPPAVALLGANTASATFIRGFKQKFHRSSLQATTSVTSTSTTTRPGRIDLIPLQKIQGNENIEILSQDPLVYVVRNLLSEQECRALQDYVLELDQQQSRPMTRSNPPQVSLNVQKLWPLIFLSMGTGVPTAVRMLLEEQKSWLEIVPVIVPTMAGALLASVALAFGIVLPLIRRFSDASSRTSVAAALNQMDDAEMIRPLVDKVSNITLHPWFRWEAPVVTRYDVGAIFARHGDASPIRGQEWIDLGGQRVVTCICYLNTLAEEGGGETYFDQLNLAVGPETGKALIFFPAHGLTWEADDRTTHESLPPTNKEKWIVQMFGRAERVPPPLGLADAFETMST